MKKQFGFYFNQSRCIGCRTCQMSCKDYKRLNTSQNFRRVYEYEGGTSVAVNTKHDIYQCSAFAYYTSISCNHCANPACLKVCPTGALMKSEKTGVVSVNEKRCIGCKSCAMACPYGAMQFNEQKGVMQKCNGCAERVEAGLKPICVEACPSRALDAGEINDLRKKHATTLAAVAPLPSNKLTTPSLCITPARKAKVAGSTEGKVQFPLVNQEVQRV